MLVSTRNLTLCALFGSSAIAIAAPQDLFVSSDFSHTVKRFDGITGAFLGNFVTANSGGLSNPQGIAFGPDGNLYVSGGGSGAVHRYNGQTGASMGVFTSGHTFNFAADMEFRNGKLYVADFGPSGGIYTFDANTGSLISKFTQGINFRADGFQWAPDGNLYVSDWTNSAIRKFDANGNNLGVFATGGGLSGPLDLRIGDGGDFFVNSFNTGQVKRFDGITGVFEGNFISGLTTTQGQLIAPDGTLLVGSYQNGVINKYNATTGALIGTFASGGGLITPNNFVFNPVPEPITLFASLPLLALIKKRSKKTI